MPAKKRKSPPPSTECEAAIGHPFADRHLLEEALTHSSTKARNRPSNERLEFLGDAVLGLVISEYLFKKLPHAPEGELTRIKSSVVSRATLAERAADLKLDAFAHIGKGLRRKGTPPVSILANLFEALIAAVYLDGGIDPARRLILAQLEETIEQVETRRQGQNFKALLQEHAQQARGLTPTYRLLHARGPDHRKEFQVAALLGEKPHGTGSGPSKKEAEQQAARQTLIQLGLL
jgi:ribonuclease-3